MSVDSLIVSDLTLRLPNGHPLVVDLSFVVHPGDVLVLMGPSGSGKSTILSWLTGIISADITADGQASLGERCISTLPAEKRGLGLMLQQDYLFPHMSVQDNLLFGLRGGDRQWRLERVRESLDRAGLEGLQQRDPATLSGGQRARVSLLRTLLSDPQALLLDEPFSRLDATRREQIRQFTWQFSAKLPVLLVTHDEADIPDRAHVLRIDKP